METGLCWHPKELLLGSVRAEDSCKPSLVVLVLCLDMSATLVSALPSCSPRDDVGQHSLPPSTTLQSMAGPLLEVVIGINFIAAYGHTD